jgi:plastocyanin
LVLAAIVATPALSAAQDAGTTEAPPPSSIPAPPEQVPPPADGGAAPPDPGTPSAEQAKPEEADQASATPAPPAATYAAGSGVARAAASKSVSVGDNFYSPVTVTVSAGDSVTWANNGQAQHSATANDGSFDTGVFGPGNSRSQAFNRAGTFSYFCTVHGQSQSGTVRVLAASSGGGGGRGGGSAGASGSDSEAAAVASPDAAGTSTSLAATGLEGLGLAALGLALLGGGVALRRRIALRW